jgi:hypothetical protein
VTLPEQLDLLPWSDPAALLVAAGALLQHHGSPHVLAGHFASVLESENLLDEVEIKTHQYKVVLCRVPSTRSNLTLHVYGPGHQGRRAWIHNHRWPFVSRILCGGLVHEVFSPTFREGQPPALGCPTQVIYEPAGTTYFLAPELYHRVYAEPWTATLLVRGAVVPGEASYLLETGERFGYRGSALTPWPQLHEDRVKQLHELQEQLQSAGVLGVG